MTLYVGHDVAYFTSGQHRRGCAGAMSYYAAAGEPPGEWAGKGAAGLGLTGQVDPAVIGRLYQHNIGPGGELLVKRRRSKTADDREATAVAAYLAAHPASCRSSASRSRAGRWMRSLSDSLTAPPRRCEGQWPHRRYRCSW